MKYFEICEEYFHEASYSDEYKNINIVENLLAEVDEEEEAFENLVNSLDKTSDEWKAVQRAIEWFENGDEEENENEDEEVYFFPYEDVDGCRSYHEWIALLNR